MSKGELNLWILILRSCQVKGFIFKLEASLHCRHFLIVVQSFNCVQLFVTPWIAACQALLSSAISQSLLIFMSAGLVMLSNYLILCHPLHLLPSIFPSIGSFPMSWLLASGDQCIGASASVLPMNIQC